MIDAAAHPLLDVRGVSKRFPGVIALEGVTMTLYGGEVLAVIGENGAGKSTLMKILAGVQEPDEGEIRLDGQSVRIPSVNRAQELGISLIHQELNLCDNLSVAENVFLGREPRKGGPLGLIDRGRMRRDTARVLQRVGLDISARRTVSTLSIAQQQLVEIASALSTHARIIIMDEPTSSLTQRETERLFAVIQDLRSRGVSIVYITHRLSEVKQLADRATVFRDGRNAGELTGDQIDHDAMVRLMVGRDVSKYYHHTPHERGEPVLEVSDLRVPGKYAVHEHNFAIHAGEIVGMAGLVGAGRTELLRAIFGIDKRVEGEVRVAGQPLSGGSPTRAIAAGLGLAPEDRKLQGLILEMAVRKNISLVALNRYQRAGMIEHRREKELSRRIVERLDVKTPGLDQEVQYLSGGNQQKVVLGKWLTLHPRVLLLDEPTRGVDVGAKEEIYQLMERLAGEGVGILFVSSEMEEILGLSDRTLVMHEGRITGELAREQLSEEAVMQLATGNIVAASLSEDPNAKQKVSAT